MEEADQHDPCDKVRKRRRSWPAKPCGFAAALGRRQRVAHNSTVPTSPSINFTNQKRSCGSAGGSMRHGSALGEATLDVPGTFPGEAIRVPIQFAALHAAADRAQIISLGEDLP